METTQDSVTEPDTTERKERVKVIWLEVPCLLQKRSAIYRKFPYYKEPVEVGGYTWDKHCKFVHNRSALKIFTPPQDWNNCPFDLRAGYRELLESEDDSSESESDDEDNTGLASIYQWIIHNKEKFYPHPDVSSRSTARDAGPGNDTSARPTFRSLNVDFVAGRYALTSLLCAPYQSKYEVSCSVRVCRFRGTYYIEGGDSEMVEERPEQAENRPEQAEENPEHTEKPEQTTEERRERVQEIMSYWGFKFEQYVTADRETRIPDTTSPVHESGAFFSVSRTTLNSHSMVLYSEIDCEDVSGKWGNKYVELKTKRMITTEQQFKRFCQSVLLRWWAQSFLNGVPIIVCGFRDDDGVVQKMEWFPVLDLPKMAAANLDGPWDPCVCFNFLNDFLQFVKSTISEEDEGHFYWFEWKPGSSRIRCFKDPTGRVNLLPPWFKKWDAWDKPYTQ